MATAAENTMTKAEVEKYVSQAIESRLQKAIEEFVEKNEIRLKELSLIERVVRVEEELKALREMFGVKFDASEKRFEALQREMNARFEAVDKRFETVDKRFESLQREMSERFASLHREMNARFSTTQWMIGILVGVPALIIAVSKVIELLK